MTGTWSIPGMLLLPLLLLSLIIPVAAAQGSGSLVRGNTFTVTVIGTPRTAYDIWPEGTHDMTGEPGDQPPIIVPGQVDVLQDPPGGPYVIGSHPIRGGGTIRDDVPPDSSAASATSYYAEVKTDASGYGVVLFGTSSATATGQEFHIVAENPADLDEDVRVVLGVPTPAPTLAIPLPLTATRETALTTPPTTPTPVTTPANRATPPSATEKETTPVPGTPLPAGIGIVAAGIGFIMMGRAERKRSSRILDEPAWEGCEASPPNPNLFFR